MPARLVFWPAQHWFEDTFLLCATADSSGHQCGGEYSPWAASVYPNHSPVRDSWWGGSCIQLWRLYWWSPEVDLSRGKIWFISVPRPVLPHSWFDELITTTPPPPINFLSVNWTRGKDHTKWIFISNNQVGCWIHPSMGLSPPNPCRWESRSQRRGQL